MAKPKPAESRDPQRPIPIAVLRGTPEYRDWLNGFAEHSRMPVSVLLDRALARLAKEEVYRDPPKR